MQLNLTTSNSKLAALLLIAVAWLPGASEAAFETIEPGAYIVDMGVIPQTVGNGLKPYGLVYDLVINNGIPVKWAINPAKFKDGIDFTADGIDYRGSAFIITAQWADLAKPVLDNWALQGVVYRGKTAGSFSADIHGDITAFPNSVLDAGKGGIAGGYLETAGIPDTAYAFKEPSQLNACDDVYYMPHADPAWSSHQDLLPYIRDGGGYLWAACHAVSVLEAVQNPLNPAENMQYLATEGVVDFGDHDGGDGVYDNSGAPGDPITQFIGIIDGATENGSEQIYVPYAAGWRSSTKIAVWDDNHPETPGPALNQRVAKLAFGRAFGNPNSGVVVYEGGHNHGGGDPENVAAQRVALNLLLASAIDRVPTVTTNAPADMDALSAVGLNATVSGGDGPYSYQWFSSCGGSFSNTFSPITTFTAPNTQTDLDCVLRVRISDFCGRDTFSADVTVVNGLPLADLSIDKTDSADPAATSGDFTYTLTATNSGPTEAANVVIVDTLPPEVSFVSASPTCIATLPTVTCSFGTVNNGQTVSADITVTAPAIPATVSNTATVSSDDTDPDLSNNTDVETTEIKPATDLAITKTGPTVPVEIPNFFNYVLSVSNNGPLDATNIEVTDPLPDGVTFNNASGDGWSCFYNDVLHTVTCIRSALVAGATAPPLTVSVIAAGIGDWDNTASVRSPDFGEPTPGDNSSTVSTNIFTTVSADLEMKKNVDKDNAKSGDKPKYTFEVTNLGPNDAENVVMTDPIDPAVWEDQGVDSGPTHGSASYSVATGITWNIGSLPAGETATLVWEFKVLVDTTGTNRRTNTATVTTTTPDLNAANNTDSATIENGITEADLGVTKSDSADPLLPGSGFDYTIRVENFGPENIEDLDKIAINPQMPTVTDTLPAGVTFNSFIVLDAGGTPTTDFFTCTHDGPSNTVTCVWDASLADEKKFNNGDFFDIVINVSAPTTAGVISNTAAVSYQNTGLRDNNSLNDSAGESTTIEAGNPEINLVLSKNVDDEGADFDDDVKFTFIVTNEGPDVASGVTLTDPLDPAIYQFLSIDSGPTLGTVESPFVPANGLIWNIGTLAVGISTNVVIKAKVLVDTTGSPITNTATVTANEDDTNPSDNTDSVVIEDGTVEVDLSVVKTASAEPVDSSAAFTYTVRIGNNGPENLNALDDNILVQQVPIMVDTLPPEVIFNDNPGDIRVLDDGGTASTIWVCTYDGGAHEITCTWNELIDTQFEKNSFFDIEIDVVAPLAGGEITNTASIRYEKTDTIDNDANNNSDDLLTTVNPPNVDLAVTMTVDDAMPDLDDQITFTISVTNNTTPFTGDATSVLVSDALANEVTYISSTGDGVYNENTGVWSVGDIAFGNTATMMITVQVDMYVDFTNTAMIFGLNEEDADDTNDSASVDVMMVRADLAIEKLVAGVASTTADLNSDVTYTITVTNNGPSDATGVTVTEGMPTGLVYVSHNEFGNGTFDSGTGVWSGVSIPAAAPGNTATLEMVATVADTGILNNTATIIVADQADPDTSNNSSSASVDGIAADIEISKSATPEEVNPGAAVTYTITVTNNGPNDATNIIVNDPQPAGVTFGTATPSQGAFGAGVWTVGDLINGASATLTIPATADNTGTLVNVATLDSLDQVDSNPNNNEADANVLSGGKADLFLVKTVADGSISQGDTDVFTLYLNNFGPDDATAVVVSDALPPGLTYLSSSPAGVYDFVTGDWSVGTLASGAATSLEITVSAPTAGTYTNIATVTNDDQGDPDLTSNDSQAIVEVFPPGTLVRIFGSVYSDDNDNGSLDGTEGGLGDPVWVKLISVLDPTVALEVVLADPVTGMYSFSGNANGDYTVIVDNNSSPPDVTATPPDDWVFRSPSDGRLGVTLNMIDLNNIDFGLLSLGTDVGGTVWVDADHNGLLDGGETGLGGVTMILRNTADNSCQGVATNPDGTYSFGTVSDGQYEIIESASTVLPVASPCTVPEADPTGHVSTTTNTRLVTVTGVPVPNQNFGDFAGSVLRGRVIEDSGIGTGTAYDAVLNGAEPPRGGVRIDGTNGISPTQSTETNGEGEFEFWIPATAPVFKVFSAIDSGWVSVSIATGSTVGTVINADELLFFPIAGTEYDGVVFGDVREPAFGPDHVKTTTAGSTVYHAHTFTAYSPGEVSFSVINESSSPSITGWTSVIYADDNCNAELDPGEAVISASVTVDAEPDNQVCILTKVFSPASAPDGAQYQFEMQAEMEFTGSLAPNIVRERTDLTIISGDGLAITKAADKTTALPGEIITYTITYRNTSAEPLDDIVINDATPAFTNFFVASCGPLPASISACNLTQQPTLGAKGPVEWTLDDVLLPGQEGTVEYQVRVDN